MLVGTVIGKLWATQKTETLGGLRLLVIRPFTTDGDESAETVVAVDPMGAGIGERVLVVDSGPGYLAALAEAMGGEVTTISPEDAAKRGKGEFDVVLVDGAVEDFPKPLVKRVAEGGRIFTGTVTRGVTRIAAGRVYGGEVSLLPLAEMGVPVMPEFAAHEEWSF